METLCPQQGERNSLQCPSQFVEPLPRSVKSCRSPHTRSYYPGTFSEPTLETRTRLVRYGPTLDRLRAPEECAVELKISGPQSLNLVTTASDIQGLIDSLLRCQDSSALMKLLRVTAYLLRAVARFKGSTIADCNNVTSEEIAHAEMLWISCAQRQITSQKEFKTIQQQFNLFQDEKGIWRCGGRL